VQTGHVKAVPHNVLAQYPRHPASALAPVRTKTGTLQEHTCHASCSTGLNFAHPVHPRQLQHWPQLMHKLCMLVTAALAPRYAQTVHARHSKGTLARQQNTCNTLLYWHNCSKPNSSYACNGIYTGNLVAIVP